MIAKYIENTGLITKITVEQISGGWEVVEWYGDDGETLADDFYTSRAAAISAARKVFNENPSAQTLSAGTVDSFGAETDLIRSRIEPDKKGRWARDRRQMQKIVYDWAWGGIDLNTAKRGCESLGFDVQFEDQTAIHMTVTHLITKTVFRITP